MNFESILEDLEIAVEAISVSDYKATAKAAKLAIKSATKLMKSGDYDGAITKCDEAIASIKAVKAQIRTDERRGEDGEEQSKAKMSGAVKAIAIGVLSALVGAAAVVGAQKFGGKVANNKHLTGAQSKVGQSGAKALNKIDEKKRDRYEDKANKANDNGDFERGDKYFDKHVNAANKLNERAKQDRSADGYAARNQVRADKIAGTGKKGIATGAAVFGVGAGVIQALKAFVTNKKCSPEAMDKALDMCIKSLEGIKASCNEAKRGKASESVIDFFDGVSEALLATSNESVIMDLLDCGMDDLMACEMYVNFVVPAVVAYETYGDAEDDYEDYDEYFDEDEN